MAGHRNNARPGRPSRLWIKILVVPIAIIILANVGLGFFYLDQGAMRLWANFKKDQASIARNLNNPNNQEAAVVTFEDHQTNRDNSRGLQRGVDTVQGHQTHRDNSGDRQMNVDTPEVHQTNVNTKPSELHQTNVDTSEVHQANMNTSQFHHASAKTSEAHHANAKTSEAHHANAKTSEAHQANAKTSEAPHASAKTSEAPHASAKTSEVHQANAITSEVHQAREKTSEVHQASAITSEVHQTSALTSEVHQARVKTSEVHQANVNTSQAQQATDVNTSEGHQTKMENSQEGDPRNVDTHGGHPLKTDTSQPHHSDVGDTGGPLSKDNLSENGQAHTSSFSDRPTIAENEGPCKDSRTRINSTHPTILWWDPIDGQGEEDIGCGQHTCRVTTDRRHWQEHDVMMISFYGASMSCHDLPVPRGEGHLWALYHDESPQNRDFLFSHQAVMEIFNYTATFRRHSHLPFPTQWLNDVEDLTSGQYVVPVADRSDYRRTRGLAPVVYVQSDCGAPSDRDHFVQLLQQHLPVDSYGQCLNNKKFPKGDFLTFHKDMSAMTSEDFYRLLAQYKFALAMENAVCPGYITEKFWRPLQLGVVPIVFGASNIKEFLPSDNSALVVNDFNSAEDLAKAILYYDSHDTEYSQLLQFKHTGITNPLLKAHLQGRTATSQYRVQMLEDYHCMLCEKLHEAVSLRQSCHPIPQSVASTDHYGCPKPGKFNDKGQYVAEDSQHWSKPWAYSQAMACLMRILIDNGTRLSLDAFNAQVDHTQRNFDDLCLKYF